jgi:hypothetical protein
LPNVFQTASCSFIQRSQRRHEIVISRTQQEEEQGRGMRLLLAACRARDGQKAPKNLAKGVEFERWQYSDSRTIFDRGACRESCHADLEAAAFAPSFRSEFYCGVVMHFKEEEGGEGTHTHLLQ